MSQKAYAMTTGLILLLIAAGHAFRLAFGWTANIAGQSIATWVSWIALVIFTYLAAEGFRQAKKA